MNLSTFNSNYLFKIILLIVFSFGLYLIADFTEHYFQEHHRIRLEKKDFYSNDIDGKKDLMAALYPRSHPDIIFVGSSTTENHIASQIFKSANLAVFNYGLNGHFLAHYPSMVTNAIKSKPKIIALSIDKPQLYHPILAHLIYDKLISTDYDTTAENTLFFLKHATNLDSYGIATHLVFAYGYHINYFASEGYKIRSQLAEKYLDFDIKRNFFTTELGSTDNHSADLNSAGGGDGILTGQAKGLNFENFGEITHFSNEQLNEETIGLVNHLLDQIQRAGIKPIVIFPAQFYGYSVDDKELRKRLHAEVIDLTDLKLPKDYWHNTGHYNEKGREVYSLTLVKKIKPFVG
jgi:hypothetical protein